MSSEVDSNLVPTRIITAIFNVLNFNKLKIALHLSLKGTFWESLEFPICDPWDS